MEEGFKLAGWLFTVVGALIVWIVLGPLIILPIIGAVLWPFLSKLK